MKCTTWGDVGTHIKEELYDVLMSEDNWENVHGSPDDNDVFAFDENCFGEFGYNSSMTIEKIMGTEIFLECSEEYSAQHRWLENWAQSFNNNLGNTIFSRMIKMRYLKRWS